ncbi:hypothetical protein H0H81_008185 [Sphagnurus paluster]|uniref:LIM zinc-binding domain-containing protein n=1 Tax=Sphagnurus paluster TaxID=117069 RepID=A0A9P7G176_9AGAR|nr:hypothetical protein H0H81_008185 [Sphagnurus paluster]
MRNSAASAASLSFQSRPSPLARTAPERADTVPLVGGPRFGPSSPPQISTSALRTRPPAPADFRPRTDSNTGSAPPGFPGALSPAILRPSFSASPRDPNPQYNNIRPPPPRDQVLPQPREPMAMPPLNFSGPLMVPQVSEKDIDTKIGGEAGMAGVGRRGFAAAARAAMLAVSADRTFQQRRDNAPYLNTNFLPNNNDTPPLSAGSGYSSHSPGISPYPQSPVAPQAPPSPEHHPGPASQPSFEGSQTLDKPGLPSSPISPRLPFFEQLKNQLPGVAATNPALPYPTNTPEPFGSPSTAKPLSLPRPRESTASSASSYSQGLERSPSMSTTTSRRNTETPRPASPASDSSSEYGGLAYADSSDYEDEDGETRSELNNPHPEGKDNSPPPLALTASILRSGSIASVNHVRFPSTSGSDVTSVTIGVGHKRDTSVSSLTSVSSAGGEARKSNSAAVAQALGLSQVPPSAYGRLGGPGVGGGRSSRSGSGSSSGRSAYSRGAGSLSGTGMGAMEKEMKTLLEEVGAGAALEKSNSTGKQRSFSGSIGSSSESGSNIPLSAVDPPAKEGVTLPEVKPLKDKKQRVKKPKVCLKCNITIQDGRWVQVDNGGVLCEKCWKNMYLPKCRRCTLPIEKQAVSSADGQLKGKYHRECFNCATCHKPFPDKSFYVFDGKPLCAYHYHEANDSLCSAARCGQPIEGPCAVSHNGDRYHPEHMTCEYPGNAACNERLDEYWEVDGRMLCERHAHASKVAGSDDEEAEEEWVQSSRALKRVTRFIDLGDAGLR